MNTRSESTNTGYNPTKAECIAKAQRVDVLWLSQQPASKINELDWQLSVCEGKYTPLNKEGVLLISEAHGSVADEFRKRLEKAIGRLSPDLQKQVWEAFNSDSGDSKN
jgi:hypothetical protein